MSNLFKMNELQTIQKAEFIQNEWLLQRPLQ